MRIHIIPCCYLCAPLGPSLCHILSGNNKEVDVVLEMDRTLRQHFLVRFRSFDIVIIKFVVMETKQEWIARSSKLAKISKFTERHVTSF